MSKDDIVGAADGIFPISAILEVTILPVTILEVIIELVIPPTLREASSADEKSFLRVVVPEVVELVISVVLSLVQLISAAKIIKKPIFVIFCMTFSNITAVI